MMVLVNLVNTGTNSHRTALERRYTSLCGTVYGIGIYHTALCGTVYGIGIYHTALCGTVYGIGIYHTAPCDMVSKYPKNCIVYTPT
jgi:hypothetical protein